MNTTATGPLNVVLTRGVPESVHVVDVVVSDTAGPTVVWGEADASVIPRSAIKAIQTLPLIKTGAADAFDVSDIELALVSASHSAEPAHVEAVEAWLRRIGLAPDALECGATRPISAAAADELLIAGRNFGPIHNCCSGKHTGFLTTAAHLGFDPRGYIERGHPVQGLVTASVSQFTGVDLTHVGNGRDGCGIPTFPFPARILALAMANFACPDKFDDDTVDAVRRLSAVLEGHPWWVAGTGRAEVTLTEAANQRVVLKGGAEGVFMGALPEQGLGIAVKPRDGSGRAGDAAMAAILEVFDVVPAGMSTTPVRNAAGTIVGEQFVRVP